MPHAIYILQSLLDQSFYIGSSAEGSVVQLVGGGLESYPGRFIFLIFPFQSAHGQGHTGFVVLWRTGVSRPKSLCGWSSIATGKASNAIQRYLKVLYTRIECYCHSNNSGVSVSSS